MTPRQRDIVLVPVPFTDLTSTKRRPVLVLSKTSHNRKSRDVVGAAITSNLATGGVGVNISAADLDEGALTVDSRVLADKIYTISKGIIIKRFGRLNDAKFQQVLAQVDVVLGR